MDARERHLATREAKTTARHPGDGVLRHLLAESHEPRHDGPFVPADRVAVTFDTDERPDLDPTATAPAGEPVPGAVRPDHVTEDRRRGSE